MTMRENSISYIASILELRVNIPNLKSGIDAIGRSTVLCGKGSVYKVIHFTGNCGQVKLSNTQNNRS